MKKFRLKAGAVLRTSGNYSGVGPYKYEQLTSGETVGLTKEQAETLKEKIEEVKDGNA